MTNALNGLRSAFVSHLVGVLCSDARRLTELKTISSNAYEAGISVLA